MDRLSILLVFVAQDLILVSEKLTNAVNSCQNIEDANSKKVCTDIIQHFDHLSNISAKFGNLKIQADASEIVPASSSARRCIYPITLRLG